MITMQKHLKSRYPLGINSLDVIIKGGLPQGSFILLLGDVSSGARYFAYSAMLTLSSTRDRPAGQGSELPEKICYISFTKPKEYILRDISNIKISDIKDLEKKLVFVDLSDLYFKKSKLPRPWINDDTTATDGVVTYQGKGGLIDALIDILNKYAENSLVIIDTLNDLMRLHSGSGDKWQELIMLLKGIERMAKTRNTSIYALQTMNVFGKDKEEEVADSVDAVLVFKWDDSESLYPRRIMFVKKFRGFMPFLEQSHQLTFETKVSVERGFEVSNIKEVIGKF